jgi:hypothetical protein
MAVTVVTFYTPNYLVYRDQFQRNMEELNFKYFFEEKEPLNKTKESNTKIKPLFIKDCLKKFDSVVWCDIDNVITKMDMSFSECDIGILRQPRKEDGSEPTHPYTVGWIYLRATEATFNFIDRWIAHQKNMKHDHSGFTRTLRTTNVNTINILDVTSCVKFLWNGSSSRTNTNHKALSKFHRYEPSRA